MHIKAVQRRMRKLVSGGLLSFVMLPSVNVGKSAHLFYLTEDCAKSFGVRYSKPRISLKLGHQQENIKTLVDIYSQFKGGDVECEVMPEHILRERYQLKIIPDGVFVLKRNNKHALFLLEICSGTEIISSPAPSYNEDIEKKFLKYVSMFQENETKEYEEWFSCNFTRFRVLFIANNTARLKSISRIISSVDRDGFIWITTMPQLIQSGIKANIWSVPGAGETGKAII
jgi:hypothetical protein